MNLCAGAGLKPGGQGVRGCVCRVGRGGAVMGVGGGKERGGGGDKGGPRGPVALSS